MKFFKKKYIFFLPFFFLISCVDDLNHSPYFPECEGDIDGIEFMVESASVRTRSVDFKPGAMVKINSVWVGVFDINSTATDGSYACVSKNAIEQSFIEINSTSQGKDYKNLIRVPLDPPSNTSDNSPHFFMISVVNFNGVNDQDGTPLKDRLEKISSWKEFIEIAVDTKTGYSYPHDADSPMMAGFLRHKEDAHRSAIHVQVDQFDEVNKNAIFPSSILNQGENTDLLFNFDPNKGENGKGKYVTDGKSIRLRRLVANINVNIEVINPDIEITNVTYRRHNVPEAVYIIERRTVKFDTDDDGNYINIKVPENSDETANYADKMWIKNEGGYTDDTEWQINSNRDSETGKWSFSFQHFANKHWARTPIEVGKRPGMSDEEYNALYSKREERTYVNDNSDPDQEAPYYFTNLANGITDFNNKASYFEMKLHLIDTKLNRCAEAVYVIHEGNTSNPDGTEVEDQSGNLDDFTVARNISYNYNVKVAGFENIFLNVSDKGSDDENEPKDYTHHPDQGGKVWQMIYLNDPNNNHRHYFYDSNEGKGHFENVLKGSRGDYIHSITLRDENNKEVTANYIKFENAMTFDARPNLAFRLYGYTDYRTKYNRNDALDDPGISGYNYNFERSSFSNLYGLWPQSAGDYSHYFMDDISLDINQIPVDLRNGVVIMEQGNPYPMNMIEFVNHASVQTESKTYDVYISESNLQSTNEDDKDKFVRAIYIADRKGVLDPVDKCSQLINVYCIAQYPDYTGQNYDMIVVRDNNSSILPSTGNDSPYFIENNLTGISGIETHGGKGMILSSSPDLAFRLIGFDDNDNYVDICYNFNINQNIYLKYRDFWPAALPTVQNNLSNIPSNLENLMSGLKIHTFNDKYKEDKTYTIKELIDFIKGNNNSLDDGEYVDGFVVDVYNHTGEISQSIRRLYVFDKNLVESNGIYDNSYDEFYRQIYGVSQYPHDNSMKVVFNANPLGHKYHMENWQSQYNDSAEKDLNHQIYYVDAAYNWCGTIDSFVEMPIVLTNSNWIESYKFDFYLGSTLKATKVYEKDELSSVFVESDGYYVIKLNTNEWSPGSYDVVISAIPADKNIIYSGNDPVTLPGQLYLSEMKWDFSEAFWEVYRYSNVEESIFETGRNFGDDKYDKRLDGTTEKPYTKEKNFIIEYNGLELGAFELHQTTSFINNSGYLNTMADFDPSTIDDPDLLPLRGNSYQLGFTVTKKGSVNIYMQNSKAEEKNLYIELGANLKLNGELNTNFRKLSDNLFYHPCTHTAWETITLPIDLINPEITSGNNIKIYTRQKVLRIQKIEYNI